VTHFAREQTPTDSTKRDSRSRRVANSSAAPVSSGTSCDHTCRMRHLACCTLVACLYSACGGQIDASGEIVGAAGGETSIQTPTGGAQSVGGTTAIDAMGGVTAGGHSGTESCIAATVTITLKPSAASTTRWCIGKPGGCSNLSELLSNRDGPLSLWNLCTVDCNSCQPTSCHSVLCAPPQALNSSLTLLVWDGTYYEHNSSSCSSSELCAARRCAARDDYSYTFYAYPNPDPDAPDGCTRASSDTPPTTLSTSFVYPDDANIVIEI
jgi:hypothetical protein